MEESDIPALLMEEGDIPALLMEESDIPALLMEEGDIPALLMEEGDIPALLMEKGNIPALLMEGKIIQLKLKSSSHSRRKDQLAKKFSKLMSQGKVQAAMRLLSSSETSILAVSDMVEAILKTTGRAGPSGTDAAF
jgi:hypothetical protein